MTPLYLDYNASTPLWPEAKEPLLRGLEFVGNPTATHHFGAQCKKKLEEARQELLDLLGISNATLIFTSGATESNFLALHGLQPHVHHFLIGATEHPCILNQFSSPTCAHKTQHNVHICKPDTSGVISPDALAAHINKVISNQGEPSFLVSIGAANHETGVVQDIDALASVVHAHNGWIHTDACQALGKIPLPSTTDLMTLSSHKVGGPVGIGALILKDRVPFTPPILGGGQEGGLRSGTPALALALGFVAAVKRCLSTDYAQHLTHCRQWRDDMESHLQTFTSHMTVLGQKAQRLPQTSCLCMPGVPKEVQMALFDLEGIAISAGSACHAGSAGPSPVLSAMNASESVTASAIRVSMGAQTRKSDIERFIHTWKHIYAQNHQGTPYDFAA